MDTTLEKKLSGFKQIALEKLENILLTIIGKKDLVIEPELIRILDCFASMTWLRTKGFDKIFKLSSTPPPKTKTLVFFIGSDLLTFKHVCDQITFLKSKSEEESFKEFHVIVVPNIFISHKKLLETEGLEGFVALYRFSWDFIKIDRNLLSLELPQTFRDVFVRKDTSLLSSIAASLRIFNMVHGRPKITLSFGENSEKIVEMVHRMENSNPKPSEAQREFPDFSAMIVMDRDKDFQSLLLTPVTYSSLMVELFELSAGILTIDTKNNKINSGKLEVFKANTTEDADVKTLKMCGTSDELYAYNNRHFSEVVNLIKSESKNLEEERNKYNRDMNIEEMKEFVQQNLPKVAAQKKILYKHLIICEKIVQELSGNFERQQGIEENILCGSNRKQVLAYIDEQLFTNPNQWNSLRLICLYHVCCGFEDNSGKFIGNYLNTFGHKNLGVFQNLARAKLFPEIGQASFKNIMGISLPQKKTQFQNDAAKLKLIPANDGETTAKGQKIPKPCPSYVFNGNFVPLVAQLSNFLLKSESFADFTNQFGNLENLKISTGVNSETLRQAPNISVFPIKPRTLFVFIVGGITFAEVAACSLIAESLTGSKIVLASDRITSGIDVMKSATW